MNLNEKDIKKMEYEDFLEMECDDLLAELDLELYESPFIALIENMLDKIEYLEIQLQKLKVKQ
jgi:hypothetical protein